MPYIVTRTVTVYQALGRGRRWFTKAAAYRSAAIAKVNERCKCPHGASYDHYGPGPEVETPCRYCSRAPEKPMFEHFDGGAPEIEHSPPDSYRWRLVGRLARWMQWRDSRTSEVV